MKVFSAFRECKWCGEPFHPKTKSRFDYICEKPECQLRQKIFSLILKYKRCIKCGGILPRGSRVFFGYRSIHFCPFCVATPRECRNNYSSWVKTLDPEVDRLLPNPVPSLPQSKKQLVELVKAMELNVNV